MISTASPVNVAGSHQDEHVRGFKDAAVRVLAVTANEVEAGGGLGRRHQRPAHEERRAAQVARVRIANE